jgi:hypothetical protein
MLTGEFYLDKDTILYISMERLPTNTDRETNAESVKIWPNPIRDFLYCLVPDVCSELILRITDPVGREIYNKKVNENNFQINLAGLKPGVYILKLISSEIQTTRLFIKD